MFKLIIEDDEGKTTVVPLIRDDISIGRKEGNTIRLTERNVSRKHARLVRDNGTVFLEDLSSHNGVKVNGSRIAGRVQLREGDRVQIGDYQLALSQEHASDAAGARQAAPLESEPTQQIRVEDLRPPEAFEKTERVAMPPARSGEAGAGGTGMEAGRGRPTPPPRPKEAPRRTGQQHAAASGRGPADKREVPADATEKHEPAPRLVCTSTNYAGRELVIDKPSIVIGRGDDADFSLPHKSISRHHVRVAREGGAWVAADLQSANGIKINGQKAAKRELRQGDLIDLGQVRLRFVGPHEDFVFARDAVVVDLAKGPGAGGGKKLAIAALGAVAVAGALVMVVGRGGSQEQAAAPGVEPAPSVAPVPAVPPASPPAPPVKVATATPPAPVPPVASAPPVAPPPAPPPPVAPPKPAPVAASPAPAPKPAPPGGLPPSVDMGGRRPAPPPSPAPARVARAEPTPRPRPAPAPAPAPPAPRGKGAALDPAAIQALEGQLEDTYVKGDYQQAIKVGRTILRSDAENQKAIRTIGASACFLHDKATAMWAYNKMTPQNRQLLIFVCKRNNVTIP